MLMPIRHGTAVLVDENTFQRKMLRTVLRSSGFTRVTEFEDLENGLDEASRLYPDFLFIDFETAQKSELFRGHDNVRDSFLGANTHLFFLMKNPTRQRVSKAVEFGAHWVISRPFSPKSLNQRLRAIVEPNYAMIIPPANPTAKSSKNSVEKPDTASKEELDMVELAAQMQNLMRRSTDYPIDASSIDTASRKDFLTRIEVMEKDLKDKPKAAPAPVDESIFLI